LAVVIAHERVHAQGEKSERKAIEEEIRILEVFVVRRLVELQWLTGRKATLAQIMNRHLSDEPFKVIPSGRQYSRTAIWIDKPNLPRSIGLKIYWSQTLCHEDSSKTSSYTKKTS
jgi:hypothetical protein